MCARVSVLTSLAVGMSVDGGTEQSGGSFKDVEAARGKISKLQAGIVDGLEQEVEQPPVDDEIREGDAVILLGTHMCTRT